MKIVTYVMLVCLFLFGCATQPIPTNMATPVAANTVLCQSSEDSGDVIVKRDSGLYGSGCAAYIYFDGKQITKLWPSQKMECSLSQGKHIVSVKMCFGTLKEKAIFVERSETLILRVGVDSAGSVFISETAF